MVSWIPESLMNENNKRKVSVKLLCGGDLLESFAVPGLWANEDVRNQCLNSIKLVLKG